MIISPFSVAMALLFLSQATNGHIFEEIRNGLHLNIDKAAIADQFQQYHGLIQKSAGQSELMIAYRIYVQQGFQLNTDFQEVAVKKYFPGVEFARQNETAEIINQFVKEFKLIPWKLDRNSGMRILNDLNATALDYAISNLSLVIVLPNDRTGLHALESQITNVQL